MYGSLTNITLLIFQLYINWIVQCAYSFDLLLSLSFVYLIHVVECSCSGFFHYQGIPLYVCATVDSSTANGLL